MSACKHAHATHGKVYDYCPDCGAVRRADAPGVRPEPWHTCETTHCRAGWVVHLAGAEGYALEKFHNTALAAQLIYRESGCPINPARFYESTKDAMADIERCALASKEGTP